MFLLLLTGCVEPYAPDVIDAPPSLLVVDGFINAAGPTTIRLSRTASLNSKATPPAEGLARLVIEQQNGPSYPLSETVSGTYVSVPLTLPAGILCRLRITTLKGQQYASDFVPVKRTPPIDELRWKPEADFNFYLSTQDPTGASKYYRWEYDETWEIVPAYRPNIEYYDMRFHFIRSPYPYPDVCWASEQGSKIVLSQTTSLSDDRVRSLRLRTLPSNSSRLFRRYSLNVRQHALTAAEYSYWEQLRKNTETLGSLFDPQPSQLTGNVRSLDAAGQPALGFVGAHSVSEKRIFVERAELPTGLMPLTGYNDCMPPDTIDPYRSFPLPTLAEARTVFNNKFRDPSYLPIESVRGLLINVEAVTAKSRDCIDCRLRGTAIRPSFW